MKKQRLPVAEQPLSFGVTLTTAAFGNVAVVLLGLVDGNRQSGSGFRCGAVVPRAGDHVGVGSCRGAGDGMGDSMLDAASAGRKRSESYDQDKRAED